MGLLMGTAAGAGFRWLLVFDRASRILDGRRCCRWQTNLDLQAALWPVAGLDAATVNPNGALGNGEPQPHSAGLTATGIINAIEWAKELVQFFFGHAWTRVHDPDNRFRATTALAPLQHDLHTGAFSSIASGVANNVFNRAVQQDRRARDHTIFLDHTLHAAIAALGLKIRIRGD